MLAWPALNLARTGVKGRRSSSRHRSAPMESRPWRALRGGRSTRKRIRAPRRLCYLSATRSTHGSPEDYRKQCRAPSSTRLRSLRKAEAVGRNQSIQSKHPSSYCLLLSATSFYLLFGRVLQFSGGGRSRRWGRFSLCCLSSLGGTVSSCLKTLPRRRREVVRVLGHRAECCGLTPPLNFGASL